MTSQRLMDEIPRSVTQALQELGRSSDVRAKSKMCFEMTKTLFKAGLASQAKPVTAATKNLVRDIERESSEEVRAEAFSNVLKALAIADPVDDVIRLAVDFPRVIGQTFDDSVFWVISSSVSEDLDDVDKAFAFMGKISNRQSRVRDYAYADISKAYARLGRTGDALRMATRIGDESKKSFCMADCALTLSEAGAAEDALAFVREVSDEHVGSSPLFGVAQNLADLGRIDEAREVLEQAQALPQEQRPSSRESASLMASRILATLGEFDKALAVAGEIEPDRPRYSSALAGIGEALASKGDLPGATALASTAANRDEVELGIVRGLTTAGRFNEAEEVINRLRDQEQRANGWESLGHGFARDTNADEVVRVAGYVPGYRADNLFQALVQSLTQAADYQDAMAVAARRWPSDPFSRLEALAVIFREANARNPELIEDIGVESSLTNGRIEAAGNCVSGRRVAKPSDVTRVVRFAGRAFMSCLKLCIHFTLLIFAGTLRLVAWLIAQSRR